MTPECFGKSNNPEDSRCKACALFLACAIRTARAPSGDLAEIGHTPAGPGNRPNDYTPYSRRWIACAAVNMLKMASFTEADLLPLYVGLCHTHGVDPGSAERNVHCVVTQLVKRGVLKRTKRIHLSYVE